MSGKEELEALTKSYLGGKIGGSGAERLNSILDQDEGLAIAATAIGWDDRKNGIEPWMVNEADCKLSGRVDDLGWTMSDVEVRALYEAGNPYSQ